VPVRSGSAYALVYATVRRIPRGRVSTYGHIARVVGCHGARQVGYALHALDDGTSVPWHRVVNARGSISLPGSSGITQRLRLEREGVQFNARGVIDLHTFGWPRSKDSKGSTTRSSAGRGRSAPSMNRGT
jgi:methylated-DNA-protein-cysteine methyltransferase-like protein